MSGHTAQVTLRYQPGADVLSGEVDLRDLGDSTSVIESPDGDSSFVWASQRDSDSQHLSSFHLVHASARLDSGTVAELPASVLPVARILIATAIEALAERQSLPARLRARAEASTDLALDSVKRPVTGEHPGKSEVEPSTALKLSTSLTRLSDTLHQRAATDDESTALNGDHLSRLLLELSSTITGGRPQSAPG